MGRARTAPAARAVVLARLLPLVGDLDGAGYAALAAPTELIAFARTDCRWRRRRWSSSCHAPSPGRPASPSTSRRATWRHVLVDDLPDASGTLALDAALAAFPAVVLAR